MYYVKKGKKKDSSTAAKGIAFWHALNRDFYLLTDPDENNKSLKYYIRFELTLEQTDDPRITKERMDAEIKSNYPDLLPCNTLQVVKKIKSCSESQKIDQDSTAGLTCGVTHISIKRKHAENGILAAHEIGHTLGLRDCGDVGLMNGYNKGYSIVFDSYIKMILEYSFCCRENKRLNHYDYRIPKGTIHCRNKTRMEWPGRNPIFDTTILNRSTCSEVPSGKIPGW
ncbi:MAG: hypothetical protein ACTHMC_18265 [Pseudobacter sp.]|uniref:hypothetical protein n=1 Tax=Pseudobacter sp. TaxID=2045420 RepID=UPI003F7FC1E6